MRVVVVGGGPGGLYLSSLLAERRAGITVDLYERNATDETFGFGVVFSRPTLRRLRTADPAGFDGLFGDAVRWPGIDVAIRGERWRCEGNDFAAIERRRLLMLLTERARAAGVRLHHGRDLHPGAPELAGADVVVIANGANSRWRESAADRLGVTVSPASAKFIWLAATRPFAGMTFLFERNEHGWFAVHGYPYSADRSTFVVETDERTWRAAGLDSFDVGQPPGPSDELSRKYLESLFAPHLGGAELVANNSRWANFRTIRTEEWVLDERTVLLGDAAHTAHFSVGSGTKMAMEDALVLSEKLGEVAAGTAAVPEALQSYEDERRPDVWRIQDLARPSLSWWEHFGEYADLPVAQFTYHFLTRSGRISRHRLAKADHSYVDKCLSAQFGDGAVTVLDQPLDLPGGRTCPTRVIGLVADAADRTGTEPTVVTEDLRAADRRAAAPARVGSIPALWLVAPMAVADVEDVLARDVPTPSPGTIVLVDAAVDHDARARQAQIRMAEILRIRHGVPVALVLREADADEASSLVLAGRADLVAVPVSSVSPLLSDERRLAAEA